MSEQLFIKGFSISRDIEGKWRATKASTNQGSFALGEAENLLIDQEIFDRFCSYLVHTLRPELEGFLEEENKQQQ